MVARLVAALAYCALAGSSAVDSLAGAAAAGAPRADAAARADTSGGIINGAAGGAAGAAGALSAPGGVGAFSTHNEPTGAAIDVDDAGRGGAATFTIPRRSLGAAGYGLRAIAPAFRVALISPVASSARNITIDSSSAGAVGTDGSTLALFEGDSSSQYVTGDRYRFEGEGVLIGYCYNRLAAASPTMLYISCAESWSSARILSLRLAPIGSSVAVLAGDKATTGYRDATGTSARFSGKPLPLAISPDGSILYVGDGTYIRTVATAGADVMTLAGSAISGGNDGQGAEAAFILVTALAMAPSNILYVVDSGKLRTVTPAGLVATVALSTGACRDGLLASVATFNSIFSIAFTSDGTAYVADGCNATLSSKTLRVISNGAVTTAQVPGLTALSSVYAGGTTIAVLGRSPLIQNSGDNLFILQSAPVPAGYYSTGATPFATLCPPGTYGSSTGATTSLCGGPCPAGSACPSGTTIDSIPTQVSLFLCKRRSPPGQCSDSYVFDASSTSCSRFQVVDENPTTITGLYLQVAAANSTSVTVNLFPASSPASPGCAGTPNNTFILTISPAAPAVFTPEVKKGLFAYATAPIPAMPLLCAPGTFSARGAESCSPCAAGFFGRVQGDSAPSCAGPCPAGSACPAGSVIIATIPSQVKLYLSTSASGRPIERFTFDASSTSCVTAYMWSDFFNGIESARARVRNATSMRVLNATAAGVTLTLFMGSYSSPGPDCTGGAINFTLAYSVRDPYFEELSLSPDNSNTLFAFAQILPPSTLCPFGTYSAAGATICTDCPAGVYGNSRGLTTAACTAPCASLPAGYSCWHYNASSALVLDGAEHPTLCPPGMWCESPMAMPAACAAGSYVCSFTATALDSLSFEIGAQCPWPVSLTAFRVPPFVDAYGGFISGLLGDPRAPDYTKPTFVVQGFTNASCSGWCNEGASCPATNLILLGTGSPPAGAPAYGPLSATGATSSYSNSMVTTTSSTPCAAGYYCAHKSPPLACPPGSFNPIMGRASCLLCAAGSYQSRPATTFCDGFCPAGSYSPFPGAVNVSSCSACPPGSYGLAEGASACVPCPAGSASAAVGATSAAVCARCPPTAYAPPGSSACTPCPPSSFPDATQSSCLVGVVPCPATTTPLAAGSATCVPLVCTPPLTMTPASATACLGCPLGTSGSPPNCTACSGGTAACPGGTSLALASFAAGLTAAAAAACPPLAASVAPAAVASPPPAAPLSSALTVLNFGITLAALLLAVVLALAARACAAARHAAAIDRAVQAAKPYIRYVDAFSLLHPVKEGASPVLHSTALGGALTLLALGVLALLAAYLALDYVESNIAATTAINVLARGTWAAVRLWPWAAAAVSGGARASGVFLRVTASGEPGACAAPLAAPVGAGLAAGAWAVSGGVPACGGATGVAQFTLACAACVFSPTSSLSFNLHYSCQALQIEAGAVDAMRTVELFSLPPDLTAAPPGALLASVSWTLAPLLSLLNDTVGSSSALGYTLFANGAGATTAPLANVTGGVLIAPGAAAVAVRVALPLESFVTTTVLTRKQTVVALLSNIVGFQGTIFSIFGALFGFIIARAAAATEGKGRALTAAPDAGAERGGAERGASPAAGKDRALTAPPERAVSVENPLAPAHAGGRAERVATAEGPPTAPLAPEPARRPVWVRMENDEGVVWFENEVTGESAWRVPVGER